MNETPTPGLPETIDDGWTVSTPGQEGMDAEILRGIGPHFGKWKEANVHTVIVARHGNLVYERYYSGDDWAFATPLGVVDFSAETPHDLRSISKSVTSLLVGIARDRGWVGDLDTPLFDFFPDHSDLRTPKKEKITLRHLLTMSAGFGWNEFVPYSDPTNSERRMIDAPDQIRYVLEQPVTREPGAAYLYNGGLTALLGAMLARTSSRTVEDIAAAELLAPLGIRDANWVRYANGTANVASGLRMRPRDVAKIGQLVLDRGVWDGRQVISPDWIDEATSPQVHGEGLFYYGFKFWLGRSLIRRREVLWISGVGWGGQRLYIVPEYGLVVLVMAGLYGNPVLQPIPGEIVLRRYVLHSVIPE